MGFYMVVETNLEEVGSWPPGPERKLSQIWHGVASPWHGLRSGTCWGLASGLASSSSLSPPVAGAGRRVLGAGTGLFPYGEGESPF